jgi:acetyl esterase/lipase
MKLGIMTVEAPVSRDLNILLTRLSGRAFVVTSGVDVMNLSAVAVLQSQFVKGDSGMTFRHLIGLASLALFMLLTLLQTANAKSDVKVLSNQAFGAHGQTLDLYMPRKNARATAVLFIHGGGFTSGSKADLAGHAKLYAQGGFVTASVDYRLAPQFPAPAALIDVNDAVDWLKARDGISRVVVVGYSAGGTLALMSGLSRQNSVAAIISLAGASDLEALKSTTKFPKLRDDIAAYVGESSPELVSPIAQSMKSPPPVFLIHGKSDELVPIAQSVILAERLRGSKLLFKVVPDVGHEVFLPNPHLAEILRDISRYLLAIDQAG